MNPVVISYFFVISGMLEKLVMSIEVMKFV